MDTIEIQAEKLIRFKPDKADFGYCEKLDIKRREMRREMEQAGKAVDVRK